MKKLGTPTHLIFWKFLQVFDILGGKIQFSQNILKSWSNVQKNYKNIFHHRGGQARDGKSHHVFTFLKMNPSLTSICLELRTQIGNWLGLGIGTQAYKFILNYKRLCPCVSESRSVLSFDHFWFKYPQPRLSFDWMCRVMELGKQFFSFRNALTFNNIIVQDSRED